MSLTFCRTQTLFLFWVPSLTWQYWDYASMLSFSFLDYQRTVVVKHRFPIKRLSLIDLTRTTCLAQWTFEHALRPPKLQEHANIYFWLKTHYFVRIFKQDIKTGYFLGNRCNLVKNCGAICSDTCLVLVGVQPYSGNTFGSVQV